MIRSWSCAGMLLLLFAACAPDGAAPAGTTVRDSAGVQVVENRGGAHMPELGWRVDDVPEVVLGGEASGSGPVMYQVMDAVRLGDGRVVVASSGTQRLEVFGPDGTHLQSWGRSGEGPGEFRAVFWLGRIPGDSVAAWDPLLARLSVFGPGGEQGRTVAPRGSLGILPRAVGLLPEGGFVVAVGAGARGLPAAGQVRRDTLAYVVLGRGGEIADTLGLFPGTETIVHADQAGFLTRPLPFGRTTVTAVHGSQLYLATGDEYEVRIYDPATGLQKLVRSDREPPPVTRDDISAYRRTLVTLGAERDPAAARRHAALLDAAPYPSRMAAVSGLQVDSQGNLWVQEPTTPGDPAGGLWTVFDPDGRARGSVRTPPGLRVRQIGEDWILGIHLDSDQAEHVQVHRLHRTGD